MSKDVVLRTIMRCDSKGLGGWLNSLSSNSRGKKKSRRTIEGHSLWSETQVIFKADFS